jgi:hypothetical protein
MLVGELRDDPRVVSVRNSRTVVGGFAWAMAFAASSVAMMANFSGTLSLAPPSGIGCAVRAWRNEARNRRSSPKAPSAHCPTCTFSVGGGNALQEPIGCLKSCVGLSIAGYLTSSRKARSSAEAEATPAPRAPSRAQRYRNAASDAARTASPVHPPRMIPARLPADVIGLPGARTAYQVIVCGRGGSVRVWSHAKGLMRSRTVALTVKPTDA